MHDVVGEPTEPLDGSGSHALELQIVADSFHVVNDGSVFNRLMDNWDQRLSQVRFETREANGLGRLREHYQAVEGLLDRLGSPSSVHEVDAVIEQSEGPAMVLTPRLRVLLINDRGREEFGCEQGVLANLDWLEAPARNALAAFARGGMEHSNHRYAVARMIGEGAAPSLVECFPLRAPATNSWNLVVRKLQLVWRDEMDTMLAEGFDLTDAEIAVCRLLLDGCSIRDIARQRGTSEGTARNQLKTVFSKTEVSSQGNLIRLLAMLANSAPAKDRGSQMTWSDPFGRERVLHDSDGLRIAYTWMGAADGAPAMLLHGIANGFLYPPEFEAALQRCGIRLFVPHRPGCGHSDRAPNLDLSTQMERSVLALAQHLRIDRFPVLTVSSSTIPAIRLAASDANPFSAIIATGRFLPFTKARLERMNRKTRTLIWAACNAPWLARVFARMGYRQMQQQGPDWFIDQCFETLPFDRETAYRPEMLPLFRNACAFSFLQGPDSFFEDFAMRNLDANRSVADISIPLHWMLGDVDIYRGESGRDFLDTGDEIADFLARNALSSFERVPAAGEMMIYQQGNRIAEELARLA